MKTKLTIFLLLFFLLSNVQGAVVDTVWVYSETMNVKVQTIVISPDDKKTSPKPVIYLLHGYSGNAGSWLGMKPELKDIADRDQLIFVCPDGKNSWYWDSPKNSSYRYETFVSDELIRYIDSHYPTVKDRKGRAISGLSMGGHGAMFLAFRHKEVFGAAGSTSGGLDIRPFPNNWEMSLQLGKEHENREIWEKHTAINQIDRLKNGELALIIDCGYSDFFFEVNNDFHKKLLKYNIDHEFQVRPGVHNAAYWKNSIEYHILFFKQHFMRVAAE